MPNNNPPPEADQPLSFSGHLYAQGANITSLYSKGLAGIAASYINKKWSPVLIPAGSKKPTGDWHLKQYVPSDFEKDCNIGMKMGAASCGLTDVDLDCEEAEHFATYWLPKTPAVFGRNGEASHYLYNTDLHKVEDKAVTKYSDPTTKNEASIVELRTGCEGRAAQTVFPGSKLPPNDVVRWRNGFDVSKHDVPLVDGAKLKAAVAKIAMATLLSRNWPADGGRHNMGAILGGVLARADWELDEITDFVSMVAQNSGDTEHRDRVKFAKTSYENLKSGDHNVFGMPALAKEMGKDVARAIGEWLGLAEKKRAASTKKLLTILDNEDVELWRSERDEGYASINVGGHVENYRIVGKQFKSWISLQAEDALGDIPKSDHIHNMVRQFEARAQKGGKIHKTWVRVADGGKGRIYIDLCNDAWEAIEVDAKGWRIVSNPPVRFRRPSNATAMHMPVRGGSVDEFSKFFRVNDTKLFVSVLTSYLVPNIPYVILYALGDAGTAKTSASRFIVQLLDPQVVKTPGQHKNEEDLVTSAQNRHIIISDNVSNIKREMADAHCRLATGGGIEKRALYTNEDVHGIDVRRPQVFTGITAGTDQPDFLDRAIFLALEVITEEKRLTEEELAKAFATAAPRLLGVLLDGLSAGIRRYDAQRVRLQQQLPRMADFLVWSEAASEAYGWKEGEVQAAYKENTTERLVEAAMADKLVGLIMRFISIKKGHFEGSASKFYEDMTDYLGAYVEPSDYKGDWMPKNDVHLSRRLRERVRLVGALGVDVTFRKLNNVSIIKLSRAPLKGE